MIFQTEFFIVIWVFFIIIAIILVFWLLSGLKILLEYERLVVFRLGRYHRTIGPGVTYVLPFAENAKKVDLRIVTLDIPRQEVITKDNIPVVVNTVVYFKVEKPESVVVKIENYRFAVQQYTQAAIRDVIGTLSLDEVLSERDQIAQEIRRLVDDETEEWGVDIHSLKMQEIEVPDQMKRAMAIQAEAEREKKATIIASQGELEAAQNIQDAARLIAQVPEALHLRTLQTIRDISQEPAQKIVIFFPSSGGLGKLIKDL